MRKYATLILGLLALQAPAFGQNLVGSGQSLPGLWAGSAAWGDYDNDGDQDLALMGETAAAGQCLRIVRIYGNDEALLFEDQAPGQELIGAYHGDLAWADYDNDGDLDLAVVGWDVENDESLRLYRNDDNDGGRVLALDRLQLDADGEASLRGVRYASLAWADYDNDGDPDLVVAGMEPNGTSLTLVYRNDGGVLRVDDANSEALVNLHNGDLAWADYDNDGDLDLAVSGENVTTTGGLREVTEFYLNDPTGTLSLDRTLTASAKVKDGALAWADYDADGNVDLAVAGRNIGWGTSFLLYRNRPTGVLALDGTFNLNTTRRVDGDLAWVDYDNDGDPDLAATGRSILSEYQAFVFANDGGRINGVSTETLLTGLKGGAATWIDYDADGRADLLLSGVDQSGERRTILYNNQGTTLPNNAPTAPTALNPPTVTSSRILFSWSPGADAESAELTYNLRVGTEPGGSEVFGGTVTVGPGNTGFKTNKTLRRSLPPDTYFWSVQTVDGGHARSEWSQEQILNIQQFVSSDQRIRALKEAAMDWGDYDNDGDLDLAILGQNRSGEAQTLLYTNDGGTLGVADAGLSPLRNGDADWGDYDNDGDLDLLLTGEDTFENRAAMLYQTDGGGLVLIGRFPDVSKSAADWGDYDNDGDLDLAIIGQSNDVLDGRQQSYTRIFANDGLGGFEQADHELLGLNNGEALWGDYDNDGDLDLAAAGASSAGTREFSIYTNEQGQLADAQLDLSGLESADLAWGDYDGDGDLDLAAGGISDTGLRTDLLVNDGNGGFAPLADGGFTGIQGGDLAWGDYDNDRDLDLAVAGNNGAIAILQVYENALNRSGATATFEQDPITLLQGLDFSAVALADIDADGDLDLVSAGSTGGFDPIPLSVVNDNLTGQFNRNLAPDTPVPAATVDSGSDVVLSWRDAADDGDDTPLSLSYNLRVGTSAEGHEVLSGNTGLGLGNAGQRLEHQIRGLASGTYFWSVQAIDDGFARSEWSSPQRFVIDTVAPTVAAFTLSRSRLGIGQTATLALGFLDEHSGVAAATAPAVEAVIGDQTFPFEQLQFTGATWSGQLTITDAMPAGSATVRVTGAVDGKGNAMAAFAQADAFVLDTERPAVTAASPEMAASDVSIEVGEIDITFSEPLDPATIVGDNFQIRFGNTPLAQLSAPVYDEATNTVRLLPEGGLLPGSQYTIEVSAALQDLAGNRPADATTWSFSTQVPALVATSPAAGALDAAGDGRITATFDAPLLTGVLANADAVTVLAESEPVALDDAPIFDQENNTLVIQLPGGFRPGTRYDVLLSGLLGGLLRAGSDGDFSWQFQTPVPELVRQSPADELTAADVRIEAEFSSPIDQSLLGPETVRITREGEALDPSDLRFDDNVLSFEVAGGLTPGSRYAVTLDGLLAGPLRAVGAGDFAWEFQTAVPQLLRQSPADELTAADVRIEAEFSSPIDQSLLGPETVRITREGEALDPSDLRFDDNVLSFEIAGGLTPGSRYAVTLDGLLAGPLRAVGAGDFAWEFQTAVPQLLRQSPDGEAATVGDQIEAEFSSPIDQSLLDLAGTIQVELQGELQAIEEADFDEESNVLSIQLADGFKPGALYEVALDGLLAGPLRAVGEGDFAWQFRTPIPALAGQSPGAGATGIATAANAIEAVFDNPVDIDALLADGSVTATRSGAAAAITGLEYIAETRTARFAIAEGLRAGTAYQLRIAAAVGGPRRQSDYTWDFQTAIPELVSIAPADESAGIGVDLDEIAVQFSAPVDAAQLTGDNFVITSEGAQLALRAGDPVDRGDNTYGLAPVDGFSVGTLYTLLVFPAVSGPLGPGQTATSGFSTAVPTLVGTAPAAGDTALAELDAAVEARFDAAIDQAALLRDGNVSLLRGGNPVAISTPAYDPATGTVSFAPTGGLAPGTSYEVRIARPVGGPLAPGPNAYSWNFSTRVPAPVATTPADGADVPSGPQRLTVAFTGPVDPALVNSRNFTLSRRGAALALADDEFSYDAATFTVSYPTVDLRSGTAYEAGVSSRVSGPLARQTRLPDLNWSFTTEVPRVAATLPADGEDGVSTAATNLQISFTQPAARQDAADFQISARALGDPDAPAELVAISGFGADESGTVLSFVPDGGFKPFTEYQVSMDRLVLGDLAEGGFSWTFRTAASLADARQGGTVRNASGQVEIYFPPNALTPGTNEISIRRLADPPGKRVQTADQTRIGSAYAVSADSALNKRATLTMRYTADELGAADPAKLGVFRLEDSGWQRLGGTSDPAGQLVLLAVERLGTFAVFEDRATLAGGLAVRELDCQPRAFSPRGSGLRGETDISFTLTGPADVTVRVYNASGRLERVIARDQAMAPGRVTLKWNGQDEDRNLVASGLYIVAVEAGGERSEKIVAVVQ